MQLRPVIITSVIVALLFGVPVLVLLLLRSNNPSLPLGNAEGTRIPVASAVTLPSPSAIITLAPQASPQSPAEVGTAPTPTPDVTASAKPSSTSPEPDHNGTTTPVVPGTVSGNTTTAPSTPKATPRSPSPSPSPSPSSSAPSATPKSTLVPTPAVPTPAVPLASLLPGWGGYADPALGISICLPPGWVTQADGTTVTLRDSRGGTFPDAGQLAFIQRPAVEADAKKAASEYAAETKALTSTLTLKNGVVAYRADVLVPIDPLVISFNTTYLVVGNTLWSLSVQSLNALTLEEKYVTMLDCINVAAKP